ARLNLAVSLASQPGPRGLPSLPTRRSSDLPWASAALLQSSAVAMPVNSVRAHFFKIVHLFIVSSLLVQPQGPAPIAFRGINAERSEEHTSELQSRFDLVCRLLLATKTCATF